MTGIWRKCLAHWDKCRQKGQILVFTAVLLPLLIAACGFTVDFGNMYMHKSRLQNAADAAAIAGGYAFRDNKENIDDHPKADNASEESAKSNLTKLDGIDQLYQARIADDGNTYYRVLLTEEVPVYFLRLFNVGDTVNVSADAVASISYSGGKGGIFDNLFSFGSGGFHTVNSTQEYDATGNPFVSGSSFFHGRIVGIGPDADMKKHYQRTLLDTIALEKKNNGTYKYVKEAIAAGDYIELEQDVDKSLDEKMADIMAGVNSNQGKAYKWDNGIDISQISQFYGVNYIYNNGGINPTLNINSPLPATSDNSPLYIVCDTPGQLGKIQLNSSVVDMNSRPIIYVYTGSNLHIHADGGFFRGIIYAPNANVEINDDQLKFYGSIVAKELHIDGKGTYIHESLTSNNTNIGSASVGLAVPPDNINWQ